MSDASTPSPAGAADGQSAGSLTAEAKAQKHAMEPRRASLEREIIVAVVVLYLGIVGVMLGVHYWQAGGEATATSAPSRK